MKLWILRPADGLESNDNPWEPWYDKAFGFVVRAETSEEARMIADRNAGDENRGQFLGKKTAETEVPWLLEKYSTCEELVADGEPGLIIGDFARA